jgi:hypothetical protein
MLYGNMKLISLGKCWRKYEIDIIGNAAGGNMKLIYIGGAAGGNMKLD